MKTIERTCACGARLSYTDTPWRVEMAQEEWEAQHGGCPPTAGRAPTCEIAPIVNSGPRPTGSP